MLSSVNIQQKFFQLAETVHLRIFGDEMSEEMREFLGNLSWSFFGGIIAAGIMFAVNILAGRWLGPEAYGKYNAIIAAFYFFIIPMGLGLDTAVSYYISKNEDEIIKNNLLSSAITVTLLLFLTTGVTLIVYLKLFSDTIHQNTKEILIVAFVLASFFVMRNLLDAILRGLNRFKDQSRFKIIESILIVIFLSILFIFFSQYSSYLFPILSLIFGYIVFIFAIFFLLRKQFSFILMNDRKLSLVKYGSIAVLGSISGFLFSGMDKFFVQNQLGLYELGLYSAYFLVSIGIAGQLGVLVSNVLFPVMAKINDGRWLLLKKMNKVFFIFFLPFFLFFNIASFLIFFLLGSSYKYSLIISSIFSFTATAFFYFTVLWWFIASEGRDGILFTSTQGILAGIFFLGMLFFWPVSIGISFIPVALSLSLLYAIIVGNIRVYKTK